MRLLLTNDDGIEAPGLNCLASMLGTEHEVTVIAPDRERSGVSHAFTLDKPLRCDGVSGVFAPDLVQRAWKCSGTPVDCVKLGLLTILKEHPPDLVVSGINRGANLSVDHLYSGTVAGAMEAIIEGRPAMAVSVVVKGGKHHHFETAAEFVLGFLRDEATRSILSMDYMLNVNAPCLPFSQVRGHKFTCVGTCSYDDCYREHRDPHGRPYYWLEGEIHVLDERPWSDIRAVEDGYVSVTPLVPDLTCHTILDGLRAKGD